MITFIIKVVAAVVLLFAIVGAEVVVAVGIGAVVRRMLHRSGAKPRRD
jgi:hypothetical protein